MNSQTKLTNLQLELLHTFSCTLPDEQLVEIRQLLTQYFLDKVDADMDHLRSERGWNSNTTTDWVEGHERTPYHPQP